MDAARLVEFVVYGLDDQGQPSSHMLEVTEAAVVDHRGHVMGRFRDADTLDRFLMCPRGDVKLVALQTIGVPREDLNGKYLCLEQRTEDSLAD
jgi:hypothetical protein